MAQKLILKDQMAKLLENGKADAEAIALDGNTPDHMPVLKLFTPWANATWLITSIDPEEPNMAFGLCDLGMGSPELGSVWLPEIIALTGPAGLKVERDIHFTADKTLSEYADAARAAGRIDA